MNKRFLLATAMTLLFANTATAQFPIVDDVADRVVQHYQQSTCEQLWQERAMQQGQPKSEREQRAIGMLRSDAQMRAAFIGRIAAPVVNKMFECGMVP